MTRPPDPGPAPAGWRWQPVPAPDWKLVEGADVPGRRCRWGRPACGRPAVAAMNRGMYRYGPAYGRSDQWWAYCADHLYGRWIEDGVVMQWALHTDQVVEAS